jgi:endonuclease YncB( thermonuclease family)
MVRLHGIDWPLRKARQYDKSEAWAKLEQQAHEQKRGLWVKPSAVPPWEYRRRP